jgi:hypothetical protein
MVEKLKASNDQNEYNECKIILEKAYENWIKHCRAKSLDTKVGILAKMQQTNRVIFYPRPRSKMVYCNHLRLPPTRDPIPTRKTVAFQWSYPSSDEDGLH